MILLMSATFPENLAGKEEIKDDFFCPCNRIKTQSRNAFLQGDTSDFLLAQVMRFFKISTSRRQREMVATRVTNSSEFGDKLKAA